MKFQEMAIQGAWLHTPIRFRDSRGHFQEQFKLSLLEQELGRSFPVKQANHSLSNKGVIRGIHWTASDNGQAKYVSCSRGAIWDVVVDLRLGSPTYGKWDAHVLSEENGASILISEGLGHAFLALENDTVANYLCTAEYQPQHEKTINPLDSTISIDFSRIANRFGIKNFTISEKDRLAGEFVQKVT
jgi:dTDP-4-dehydrorhamnose 3,5-epimerase